MKELTLQELKDIELDILKTFDAFCKENNIRYYLSHGTLLGAIRYKGFIPWDDDVDLLIPRDDYNRMISTFKDNERYKLFAFEKNKDYSLPFAKLCDMTTRKVEPGHNNGIELGVDIDLFPLDAWNDDLEKAKNEVRYIRKNMACLVMAKGSEIIEPNPVKRIIKSVLKIFCRMAGTGFFVKRIRKACFSDELKGKRYMGCKAWCVYGERGIIPAEVFAGTADIEFEGDTYPAPIDWDKYLTCLYGDYLPEPPKEKQKTHHSFKAYKL